MDFTLNKEHQQIKQTVKDFVKGEFKKEIIHDLLNTTAYPEKIWKKAGDLGFLGIHFPEAYSGEGLGMFEKILIVEGLATGDSSVGACLGLAGSGTEMLLRHGDEPLKKTWLPQVADATHLSAYALMEPASGSNGEHIKTTAILKHHSWVINGTKTFVLNGGPRTGFYIVLCRTSPEQGTSIKGLSILLVPADTKGITRMDMGKRIGYELLDICQVQFKDVEVPFSNLIGKAGNGYEQTRDIFNHACLLFAALALGTAQGAFERSFAHVRQRTQFGKKIIDFQNTRHKIASMATDIEMARLMLYQGALSCENNQKGDTKHCHMAKLIACRTAMQVCDSAIQLLGGYGYIREYDVERFYRDAKMAELLGGNTHTLKNAIAETLIGKG